MRMRLGLNIQILTYLFRIYQGPVSRYILQVINMLYDKLVSLMIFWPDQEEIPCVSRNVPLSLTVLKYLLKDQVISGLEHTKATTFPSI